jgi:DnaK suppressor protein
MRPADLQRYNRRLLQKQRELLAAKPDIEARVPGSTREGDVIDQANASIEAELQIRLHQSEWRLLRAIGEALGRVKQGTYGVCVECTEPISQTRLEAVPWTRLCRDCKERENQTARTE